MIKNYTEKVNDKMADYLEALSYEVESRKSLLGFLSEKNEINQELFNKIFIEYQDFFTQYEMAKHEFEYSYIRKRYQNIVSWNLTFYTNELTVSVEEAAIDESKN